MPGQPAPSLRVAECRACKQLFAVYEMEGVVACPGCESAVELATLEVAEIGVAAPVEVRIEAAEVPPPFAESSADESLASKLPAPPIDPMGEAETDVEAETVAETAAEPVEAALDERPPTVAEWLLRGGDPNIAANTTPAQEPVPEPVKEAAEVLKESAAKPSLSDSLGWNPGSFALDGDSEPTELRQPSSATTPEAKDDAEPTTEEFRFDFGTTPLAEQPTDGESDSVTLDLTCAPEADRADVAARPLDLEWSAPSEPRKRSWSGPLSAAAGILLVAAPAAWMAMTWPSDSELSAAANRQQRDLLAFDESPPNPYPPADQPTDEATGETLASFETEASPNPLPSEPNTLPFGEDDAAPIRDTATQPASFDAPETNEPPAFEPSKEAEAPLESAKDPFNASTPTEPSRYAVAAGDRYASSVPIEEPDTFSLPEDTPAAQAAPAPAPPSANQPDAGLVNVPYYGVDDLRQATTDGEPAGRAFSIGTLSDPDQAADMGKSYARLCYLAQVVTLLNPEASGPDVMTAELEATDVFNRLFREAGPRAESRQIAGPWIAWTGRPHGGVFFAGIPVDLRPAGAAAEYVFDLGGQRVSVVSSERLDVDRFINAGAKEIGVLGILVDNPRERIAGYQGDSDRVIWVRKTLALREPIEL